MPIDRFDTQRFEAALPRSKSSGETIWQFSGMKDGERIYHVYAGPFARVAIRSSIDNSGYAADTGEDSIRLWLEVMTDAGTYQAVKKLDSWTTRVNGWEDRMVDKMRELYRYGIKVKRTVPTGNQFWFVKAGPNEGRPCSKNIKAKKNFTWMDEPEFETPEPDSDPFPSTQMKAVEDKVSDATEPEEELASKSEAIDNGNEDFGSILDQLAEVADQKFVEVEAEEEQAPYIEEGGRLNPWAPRPHILRE